jgi:hypothetical protein
MLWLPHRNSIQKIFIAGRCVSFQTLSKKEGVKYSFYIRHYLKRPMDHFAPEQK